MFRMSVLLLSVVACRGETPRHYLLRDAPAEYRAAIARADQAIKKVRAHHGTEMAAEMARGGVADAIAVCSEKARAITAALSDNTGLEIGRSSPRLRNPKNQPPPWLASFVASLDGKRAAEVPAQLFDLGDRVGVVRPIPTAKVCTNCHGATENLDPKAMAHLRQLYPNDRAVGFTTGDLRGVFWVEVPKS
jgi:hypothetical protein